MQKPMLTNKCAVVVTDGMGNSLLPSRFGEKATSTLLHYVLDSVWTVADDILVIFDRDPGLTLIESIAPFGVKLAIDREGSSVFSRIVIGFNATRAEDCLVVPSSAPFIKPNVIFQLFESVRGFDAAVPKWRSGKIEPLLAAYNRKAFLRAAARNKKRGLSSLVDNLSAVSYVDVEKFLKPLDPELYSFFRVKDERDLKKARRIAQSRPR
jgi:molybdopterin-guanine dinucleotide biosynthesis protein A